MRLVSCGNCGVVINLTILQHILDKQVYTVSTEVDSWPYDNPETTVRVDGEVFKAVKCPVCDEKISTGEKV